MYRIIDVNHMGKDVVEVLEKDGVGRSTGKEYQSGYVVYPDGAPYLIQNAFPNLSCEERGEDD